MANPNYFMQQAIDLAQKIDPREIPVAALIIERGQIIATGVNDREERGSILGHAEINALEAACKLKDSWNLKSCSIYVTLEPCAMCAGAIAQAHIKEVIYGAFDYKAGACGSKYHLFDKGTSIIGGVLEDECKNLLTDFFKGKR